MRSFKEVVEGKHDEILEQAFYMGILLRHGALLSELGAGKLKLTVSGKTESITIAGGYVEVRDDKVRLLADSVE